MTSVGVNDLLVCGPDDGVTIWAAAKPGSMFKAQGESIVGKVKSIETTDSAAAGAGEEALKRSGGCAPGGGEEIPDEQWRHRRRGEEKRP
jgi:hypothetical protein